uniref:Uncharacterized protein n=1 Tax=viral metagenome TaxID=1070528 RepID=A0A6H2A187_9ZZZZ
MNITEVLKIARAHLHDKPIETSNIAALLDIAEYTSEQSQMDKMLVDALKVYFHSQTQITQTLMSLFYNQEEVEQLTSKIEEEDKYESTR